ncbi:MAG: TadE/TadG family type IV pilus assembly protein [Paracoccaceae bacterium]
MMMWHTRITRTLARFRRDDTGVALVEFAFVLPLMLLVFAMAVEGGRTFWAYQTAVAGVRDATRYLSRAVPSNACTAGYNFAPITATITSIVTNDNAGVPVLPSQVAVTSVVPTLSCVPGNYRISPAPVVTVTVNMTIAYPFSGIFGLNDQSLPGVATTIADSAKVFGA